MLAVLPRAVVISTLGRQCIVQQLTSLRSLVPNQLGQFSPYSTATPRAWTTKRQGVLQQAAGLGIDSLYLRPGAETVPDTLGSRGPAAGQIQEDGQEQLAPLQQRAEVTGAFQRLPIVAPADEHITSALKRASRVPGNNKLKNETQKARSRAAKQLDTLTKEIAVPLGKYVRGFPPMEQLHPFEQALLELTLGNRAYQTTLARVDTLRKACLETGKAYAGRSAKAATKKEAQALSEEGFARLEGLYRRSAGAVEDLKELAKKLRRLPIVDLQVPTLALVGAPNVGKSSLVQVLSSGLPEVCNYPFTTRSIKMGHFFVEGRRHQVTDTPGLLDRPEDERNAMERLTLACLAYLPTAVLFVADLTGECGTDIAKQWRIRANLKAHFPDKPWIDVLSKADMLEEEFDAADQRTADGVVATDAGSTVETAVEMTAALPAAVRVSSLTQQGIDELKVEVLSLLAKHAVVETAQSAYQATSQDTTGE